MRDVLLLKCKRAIRELSSVPCVLESPAQIQQLYLKRVSLAYTYIFWPAVRSSTMYLFQFGLLWFEVFFLLIRMFVCLFERENERQRNCHDIYLESKFNVQRCIENKLILLLIIHIQPLSITIYIEITFVLHKLDVELIF